MAGFAVFMTIAVYGFLILVAAGITSFCLYFCARKRIGPKVKGRRKMLILTAIAPFLGAGWLVAVLLLHVEISNRIAHQDCGLSGDPYVTLPNGYELGSHNTYDGYIKAPGYETDVPIAGPGYVRSLVDLEFSDGRFTGTQYDFNTHSIRTFSFDTKTRKYQSSASSVPASFEDMATRAQQDPTSYWKLYAQYRHHWPSYVLLLLIVFGEGTIYIAVRRMWNAALLSSSQTNTHKP
jgi:hypothetical protein